MPLLLFVASCSGHVSLLGIYAALEKEQTAWLSIHRACLSSLRLAGHRCRDAGPDTTMASSLAVTNPPVDPIPPATSTAATVWSSSMRSHHMETLMRLWHGCLAVVIALFAQLLIAGIQRPLAERNVDFPPSILAMAVVFLFFQLCGCVISGVDCFYQKHLKPTVSTTTTARIPLSS